MAYGMLDLGMSWGGGFPEIAFELGGVVGGFLILTGMGLATAAFLYGVFYLIARGRHISGLILFYLSYTFLVFAFGGMLNFLVNWKFWTKLILAAAWISGESLALARRRVAETADGSQALQPT